MDSLFIEHSLKTLHPADAWVFVTNLPTSTGGISTSWDGLTGRIIDAFAIALWPSKGFERVAYEIKISRSDWLRELGNPLKRQEAMLLSNLFYFAVVPGVASEKEFNDRQLWGCGLLEIQEDGSVKKVIRAPRRKAYPMPDWFICSFIRNARDQAKYWDRLETIGVKEEIS
jgi:hypothetical protein